MWPPPPAAQLQQSSLPPAAAPFIRPIAPSNAGVQPPPLFVPSLQQQQQPPPPALYPQNVQPQMPAGPPPQPQMRSEQIANVGLPPAPPPAAARPAAVSAQPQSSPPPPLMHAAAAAQNQSLPPPPPSAATSASGPSGDRQRLFGSFSAEQPQPPPAPRPAAAAAAPMLQQPQQQAFGPVGGVSRAHAGSPRGSFASVPRSRTTSGTSVSGGGRSNEDALLDSVQQHSPTLPPSTHVSLQTPEPRRESLQFQVRAMPLLWLFLNTLYTILCNILY